MKVFPAFHCCRVYKILEHYPLFIKWSINCSFNETCASFIASSFSPQRFSLAVLTCEYSKRQMGWEILDMRLPLSHNEHYIITRKCMTLWGEPDRVHVQNMEQLHAFDCHQNVTEPQATENHIKYTHVYSETVSQA